MPKQEEKSAAPFVVTNTQARMISIAGQDILPGHTSKPIQESMIAGVKASPAYRAGWLKDGVVAMPPPKVPEIQKMDLDQARKLIASESNLSILQAWAAADNRPEVLSAITERVKTL